MRLAERIERLRLAIIAVTNEISLFTNRLNLSDPALRSGTERLMSAVRALIANIEASEARFTALHDEVVSADRALRDERDELAEHDRPQG